MEQDGDKYHAYCLDCGRMYLDAWAYNDPHITSGMNASCKTCGGVVVVMHEDTAAHEIEKNKKNRGI